MKINIILADDHHVIREGLRLLLESEKDFLVLAEADSGRAALSAVKKFKPDLVVMDVSMPELNGMDATRRILSEAPAPKFWPFPCIRTSVLWKGCSRRGYPAIS